MSCAKCVPLFGWVAMTRSVAPHACARALGWGLRVRLKLRVRVRVRARVRARTMPPLTPWRSDSVDAASSDERACQHAQQEVARRLGQESQKHTEACDGGAQTLRPG
eukprot:scaffold14720_cov65-Phaeocystis_antarctica.AAC.4